MKHILCVFGADNECHRAQVFNMQSQLFQERDVKNPVTNQLAEQQMRRLASKQIQIPNLPPVPEPPNEFLGSDSVGPKEVQIFKQFDHKINEAASREDFASAAEIQEKMKTFKRIYFQETPFIKKI